MHKRGLIISIGIAICLLCFGCQTVQLAPALVEVSLATPEPTPVTLHLSLKREAALMAEAPQITPTPTPAPTATPEPTMVPTEEPTATPKPTAKAQATAKADSTPKPTATPKPSATQKPADPPPSKTTASPTPTPKPAAPLTPPPAAEEPVVVPGGNDAPSGSEYSAAEVELAAKTAYFEARGNGEAAYRAVICVILNRVESSKYGGGVTSVKTEVYRQSQFSVVNHSDFESTTPPDDIIGYANDILNNNNRSIPANVFFFRAEKDDKTWGSRVFYKTIGGNDFYYGG